MTAFRLLRLNDKFNMRKVRLFIFLRMYKEQEGGGFLSCKTLTDCGIATDGYLRSRLPQFEYGGYVAQRAVRSAARTQHRYITEYRLATRGEKYLKDQQKYNPVKFREIEKKLIEDLKAKGVLTEIKEED